MAKSDITKIALANSLKKLMNTTPFERITIIDICGSAGISRRTFYQHFRDKFELLNWMFFKDYTEQNGRGRTENIWGIYLNTCRYIYKDRSVYKNALGVKGQNSLRAFFTEILTPFLKQDYEDVFRNEIEADFFIGVLTNAAWDALYNWLSSTPCKAPDEFYTSLMESISTFAERFADIARDAAGLAHRGKQFN